VNEAEETFYDVSASVEETFYDVSASVEETFCDVSADVSASACSHLPDEIIMEIFSYLPPNQVWYRTYVFFWCRYGSADPHLLLMDPDPDPAPDPTPFFGDFKDAKQFIFSYFFL
jgi:hypothetical protein